MVVSGKDIIEETIFCGSSYEHCCSIFVIICQAIYRYYSRNNGVYRIPYIS